jgi:FHS family L-fucose permease-like MFS transporter
MCFIFVLAASQSMGNASIVMLCLVLCWESAVFATTFTLGLRGLGRHTKIGGSLIVAAISGGAVFPPLTGAVATHLQKHGSKRPFHIAMLIPMMCFVLAWLYPIYVNLFNREALDLRRDTKLGIDDIPTEKEFALRDMHTPQATTDQPSGELNITHQPVTEQPFGTKPDALTLKQGVA